MLIGLENQFLVFLRVAILHRFYCTDLHGFKSCFLSFDTNNGEFLFQTKRLFQIKFDVMINSISNIRAHVLVAI